MLAVSFKRYECQKSNIKRILFSSRPSPATCTNRPTRFFVIFVFFHAEKALGSSTGHTSMFGTCELNLRLSDSRIGQLGVIIRHHMLLNANIYCICLLDIG